MALWGGRFAGPTDEDLRALNDSIHFDRRMYREDIAGSQTWARALVGAGILTGAEAEQIVQGLDQVLAEFEADGFELKPGDEDIHTAVGTAADGDRRAPGRQAAHRTQPQRPGGHRLPTVVHGRLPGDRSGSCGSYRLRSSSGPPIIWTP